MQKKKIILSVIGLVIVGIVLQPIFAFEPKYTNYLSNPDYQIYLLDYKHFRYHVPYKISGTEIEKMELSCETSSLLVHLKESKGVNLTINMPRKMLGFNADEESSNFFVIANGEEVAFSAIDSDVDSMTLEISVAKHTKIIEIITTQLLNQIPQSSNKCGAAESEESPYYELHSPLRQFKSGTPIDQIQCKEGLYLTFKPSNVSPACVKELTLEKLVQRGWVEPPPDHGTGVISFDPPIKPETILAVGDNAHKSSMGLEMIPEKEYKIREDRRKPWSPNPILEIAEKDLHPKVKAMLEVMWNFEGYTVSEYDKNVLGKTVNLNSTEWDHQSIYEWLKENHKKQFGGNVDAGFTNYFRYEGRIYSLSWLIAD